MSWLKRAEIDDSYYTMGMCGAYAVALSRLTGKPLYAVRGYLPEEPFDDGSRAYEDAHVVVKVGEDLYADVRGVRSSGELMEVALFSPEITDVDVVPTDDVEAVWSITEEDIQEALEYIQEKGMPNGLA